MKGYFGIGAERISKPMNLGSLLRTAHAFGASFAFTIGAAFDARAVARADTSLAADSVPLSVYPDVASLALPVGCRLVGVELVPEAIDIPSFRHPARAAYVFGPERGSLSPELMARCDFLVRIPTRFCVNLAVAGALVMYDRMLSMGRFAERPVRAGGAALPLPAHVQGGPVIRSERRARAAAAAAQGGTKPGGAKRGAGRPGRAAKALATGEPLP